MPKPPVAPSLTKIVTIRFHPDEFASLVSEAGLRGISVSHLIRCGAFGRGFPPQRVPRVDTEMVAAMNRIGVNLNQAIHTFNRWEFIGPSERREAWQRWKVGIRELAGTLKSLETIFLQ